jgi:hypothetical protein
VPRSSSQASVSWFDSVRQFKVVPTTRISLLATTRFDSWQRTLPDIEMMTNQKFWYWLPVATVTKQALTQYCVHPTAQNTELSSGEVTRENCSAGIIWLVSSPFPSLTYLIILLWVLLISYSGLLILFLIYVSLEELSSWLCSRVFISKCGFLCQVDMHFMKFKRRDVCKQLGSFLVQQNLDITIRGLRLFINDISRD